MAVWGNAALTGSPRTALSLLPASEGTGCPILCLSRSLSGIAFLAIGGLGDREAELLLLCGSNNLPDRAAIAGLAGDRAGLSLHHRRRARPMLARGDDEHFE